MQKAIVNRLRPASWKVCVQGKEEAEHVRSVLVALKLNSTECKQERDLTDPPVYSFVVTPPVGVTLTATELQSFLEVDELTEVSLNASDSAV